MPKDLWCHYLLNSITLAAVDTDRTIPDIVISIIYELYTEIEELQMGDEVKIKVE